MTLANLHICTSLTEPSLSHTVISTKTKYAGLFDLFFTPNQAKLDMSLCASVYMCFVVTCWERTDLLALVCGVNCEFVSFPLVSWVRCGT